jgi:hypothetical protein
MQDIDFSVVNQIMIIVSSFYSQMEAIIGQIPATALFFIVGIYIFVHIYDIFFNRLSKKEIFHMELKSISVNQRYSDASIGRIIRFLIKNILFFPVLALMITVFTTVILIVMSEGQSVSAIASISVAIVIVVRILAYTNERLANEVVKLIPFALLIAIITNPSSFAQEELIIRGNELVASANSLIPMFFTFIAFEIVLQPIMQLRALAGMSKKKQKNIKIDDEMQEDELQDDD